MEAIRETVTAVNQQTENASKTQSELSTGTQAKPISREKIHAMMSVLAKRWLTKGWRVMDPDDSETMALAWIEVLDASGVPYQQYETLYRRSVGLRARRFEQGLECDEFSAEMMVACWRELAKDIERERVRSGRILTDVAATQCIRCLGAGGERVFNSDTGKFLGRKAGTCDHRPLEENEWLYHHPDAL